MKKILVTGGAGYIGSNICKSLLDSGYSVAVFDDFSTGLRSRVRNLPVEIHKGSILDREALRESMRDVDAVIHLAAKKSVEESVSNPLKYYQVNVTGSLNVIGAMLARNIKKIVFSSTAVVYKSTARQKLQEGDSKEPLSPYAHSKLLFEDFLDSLREAEKVSSISLRYFNVVGAGGIGLGDNARDNLVPKTFKALKEGKTPEIYGIDYPTDDGTCIRDYIHVTDLAEAHVQALDLVQNKKISEKDRKSTRLNSSHSSVSRMPSSA